MDRQTVRQAVKQTNTRRHTVRQTDGHSDGRRKDRHTDLQIDRQKRHKCRKTNRHRKTYIWTESKKDRQTNAKYFIICIATKLFELIVS